MGDDQSRLMLLLSEVSGDVKSLKATLEGYAREVTHLRATVAKNEARIDRILADHDTRLTALERSRSRLMGAITVIGSLFGLAGAYLSYILER